MLGNRKPAAVEHFAEQLEVEGRSLWQDARRRFIGNKAAMASLVILTVVAVMALVGPALSEYNHEDPDWGYMNGAPSLENRHYFGTDTLGRDLFVRTLYGARISLLVGLLGTLVAGGSTSASLSAEIP